MKPQQQKALIERLAQDRFSQLAQGHNEKVKEELERRERLYVAHLTQAFAMALADHYKWEPDKINELIGRVIKEFVCIQEDYLTLDDIAEWAKEAGIIGVT